MTIHDEPHHHMTYVREWRGGGDINLFIIRRATKDQPRPAERMESYVPPGNLARHRIIHGKTTTTKCNQRV